MMPNITKKEDESILFRCNCGADEFLEVWYGNFNDEIIFGSGLWFHAVSYPSSLWQAIVWWWKQRKQWTYDISLSQEDVVALRDKLNKYLEEFEKSKIK